MYKKTIIAEDAASDLVDALTDLLHVHNGDESAVAAAYSDALATALGLHYPAERDGGDGVTIEVIREGGERYTTTIATDGAWIVLDSGVPTGDRFPDPADAQSCADRLNATD